MQRYSLTEGTADRHEIVKAVLDVDDERGLQCRASGIELCGHVIINLYLESDFERLLRENNPLGNG